MQGLSFKQPKGSYPFYDVSLKKMKLNLLIYF